MAKHAFQNLETTSQHDGIKKKKAITNQGFWVKPNPHNQNKNVRGVRPSNFHKKLQPRASKLLMNSPGLWPRACQKIFTSVSSVFVSYCTIVSFDLRARPRGSAGESTTVAPPVATPSMFPEAFKKTPKNWSIFGAHLGPLWAPKMASFWLYFSVYFGPRFLVTFTAHFGPHLDPILNAPKDSPGSRHKTFIFIEMVIENEGLDLPRTPPQCI